MTLVQKHWWQDDFDRIKNSDEFTDKARMWAVHSLIQKVESETIKMVLNNKKLKDN